MDSMLEKEIPVYSGKYDVHGVIRDYGVVTKLIFTYGGKEIEMAIHRNSLLGENYESVGRDMIDGYVSNLFSQGKERKLRLHYWYIDECKYDGVVKMKAHGIVTGHERLGDSIFSHTSSVRSVQVDEKNGDMIVYTRNSVYHCPLEYCDFDKQDKYAYIIPDYERLKKKYKDAIKYPEIERGKVLMVMANFCEYYFHSLYYIPEDSTDGKKLEYSASPHVGMYQDSYLVYTKGFVIDLRYFPHFQNIRFYSEQTNGCPLFLENIGDVTLYARTSCGVIKLEPGDRKEVKSENAEKIEPVLPNGDLYPAQIID